jgi:hypothetical protein
VAAFVLFERGTSSRKASGNQSIKVVDVAGASAAARADAQKVLMDIGEAALPPVVSGLRALDSILKSVSAFFPSTTAAPQDTFRRRPQ